jgi:hypothetical protein
MGTSMLLSFNRDPGRYPGGAVYDRGKFYVVGREEAALWLHRGIVETATMHPVDLRPDVIAASDANLRPGARLTLGEIVKLLDEELAGRRRR